MLHKFLNCTHLHLRFNGRFDQVSKAFWTPYLFQKLSSSLLKQLTVLALTTYVGKLFYVLIPRWVKNSCLHLSVCLKQFHVVSSEIVDSKIRNYEKEKEISIHLGQILLLLRMHRFEINNVSNSNTSQAKLIFVKQVILAFFSTKLFLELRREGGEIHMPVLYTCMTRGFQNIP